MKVLLFSSKKHDQDYFSIASCSSDIEVDHQRAHLDIDTVELCKGYSAICIFVNDNANAEVLEKLNQYGVQHIALRCAGFNNVDLLAANKFGITVSRVPSYSPEAVAEHALALIMTLNRKTHKAYNRVRENNFSLQGLLGFNLFGKTVGVIGTGQIGTALIRILLGFGCKIMCYDPFPNPKLLETSDLNYVDLKTLIQQSDIISLHCPLTKESHHMIDAESLSLMKQGVMLINTSRGGLIDTSAVIAALKSRQIGYLGLDVYEMESELFFEDKSFDIIQDDVFDRLSGFPNVIITGHQGFYTHEALTEIADKTIKNLMLANQNKRDDSSFL